jgi:hypothetical protein
LATSGSFAARDAARVHARSGDAGEYGESIAGDMISGESVARALRGPRGVGVIALNAAGSARRRQRGAYRPKPKTAPVIPAARLKIGVTRVRAETAFSSIIKTSSLHSR